MKQVPLSALAGVSREDFDLVVLAHAENLRQHKEHHDAREAELAALAPDDNGGSVERQPYPAPHAMPLVDECVRRPDMVPDYEIVDDGPTPEQSLRSKKDAAIAVIIDWEISQLQPIQLAPGKQRMHALKLAASDPDALALQKNIEAKSQPIQMRSAKWCSQIEDLKSIEDVEEFMVQWKKSGE
jgi:hypothetical protein